MSASDPADERLEIRRIAQSEVLTLEGVLRPQEPSIFRQRLEQQRDDIGVFLVAWHGRRPVGHAFVRWHPDEPIEVPTIQQVGVVEELQRRGIGSKLLDAAERLVAERGYRDVALWVALDNVGASKFYERRGYRNIAVTAPLTWRYVGRDGEQHVHTDMANCLVKRLVPEDG